MLYRNILKHEPGFDYEFEEGTIVNITNIHEDEYGDLNFDINGEPACATPEEFNGSWKPLLCDKVWFVFVEDADEDCYITKNVYTFENIQTYSPTELMYLSKIEYIADEDLIAGFDEQNRKVVIPRMAIAFHSYECQIMKKYLEVFKAAFVHDAPDFELEEIIDEAADNIDDVKEYSKFYEIVTDMVRMR